MTAARRQELRRLEGLSVHLCLVDGFRFDDVALMSAGRMTLWIFSSGEDVFVPVADVVDFWAAEVVRSAA